ncbi:MAG: class I SAM-dependent methyltransferase [Acidimicrobiales bacterium]
MTTTDDKRQAWNERYAERAYVWTEEANQFVAAHLGDLTPGRAIDLAAGEGRNAVWLTARGWKVTAVDFSSAGLAKAARLAEDHGVTIELIEADATTWQPSEPVDLVLISYLQLPPEGRAAVLDHARTWLRPGGTLFLVGHDKTNVEGGHGGPSSPDVCYGLDETVSALEGLEITTAEVAERHVDTDDGDRVALDTLIIARRP